MYSYPLPLALNGISSSNNSASLFSRPARIKTLFPAGGRLPNLSFRFKNYAFLLTIYNFPEIGSASLNTFVGK